MDYAFINAINYIPAILLLLLLYDIMCQYWINFLFRTQNAAAIPGLTSLLKMRDNISIKCGIGLFHVHGHIKECYSRYAPTFIDGAGMIDSEIIETLWHILNDTATSARAMSWSHRQEYLDIHMGDSNWKKLTHIGIVQQYFNHFFIFTFFIVPTLLRKWRACQDQFGDAEEYLKELSSHVGTVKTLQWSNELQKMQTDRDHDITVMDQLDVKEQDGICFSSHLVL